MSPKKPYQKRLPTVLPPPPRRGPPQSQRPRVAPPRPRTPGGVGSAGGGATAASHHRPEPVRATADPAGTSAPPVLDRQPGPTTVGPEPAPGAEAAAAPPVRVSSGASSRIRDRSLLVKAILVAAAVVLLGIDVAALVGAGGAWLADDDPGPSGSRTSVFRTDGWPAAGVSRTVTEVGAGGRLDVTHWIHADQPLDEVVLAVPDLDGDADVVVTDVELVADGRPGPAPRPVAPRGAAYSFDDATRIRVSYQLLGAVEGSSSADGERVAVTTSLEVTPAQARDVRIVRSEEVVSLACASPGQQPAPCGEPGGEHEWRVRLSGADPVDRVLAVMTIPS